MKNIRKVDLVVAERIREPRYKRALTLTYVGKKLGVSFQQVQKYENGKNHISVGTFVLLLKVLGTTPDELLDGLLS